MNLTPNQLEILTIVTLGSIFLFVESAPYVAFMMSGGCLVSMVAWNKLR